MLDAGCGTGLGRRDSIKNNFKNVDGVDFSQEMLILLTKKCLSIIKLVDLTKKLDYER